LLTSKLNGRKLGLNTPLTHIFNLRFAVGKFVSVFKKAKSYQLTKQLCDDVNNFRPITNQFTILLLLLL